MATEADYFTIEEFRDVIGDEHSAYKYEESRVMRAQSEVVGRLESWARTSWRRRSAILTERVNAQQILFRHVPIIEVTGFTVAGEAINEDLWLTNQATGIFYWGDWVTQQPPVIDWTIAVLEYDYGWDYEDDEIPWEVKTPCIEATASRLLNSGTNSKIPRNTLRYSTERTDITMGRRGAGRPFPWDGRATDDIRAYWEPMRPRSIMRAAL